MACICCVRWSQPCETSDFFFCRTPLLSPLPPSHPIFWGCRTGILDKDDRQTGQTEQAYLRPNANNASASGWGRGRGGAKLHDIPSIMSGFWHISSGRTNLAAGAESNRGLPRGSGPCPMAQPWCSAALHLSVQFSQYVPRHHGYLDTI